MDYTMGMRGMEWIKWILECQQECVLLVYNSLVTSGEIGGLSKTRIDFSHSIVLFKSIFELHDSHFTSGYEPGQPTLTRILDYLPK